jgi:hypothetical protein
LSTRAIAFAAELAKPKLQPSRTKVIVGEILPLPLVRLDLVALFDKVLDEHFRGNCYDKRGIVGAAVNVVVGVYDLFGAGNLHG